jgi:hypothetical protein
MYIDTKGCMDMHPIHLRRDTSNLSIDIFARKWYNNCIKEEKGKRKMSKCDAMNCGYYYKGEDDFYPCCHCDEPKGYAPCEYDEYECEEEE